MRLILTSLVALLCVPSWSQPNQFQNRKEDIAFVMEAVYSVREFLRIAERWQMSIDELCDYPAISPTKKPFYISSGFGMRLHPVFKTWLFHTGIDIPKTKGTPVYATGNGVVTRKGYEAGYGMFIEIEHAGGFRSFYAHFSKIMVNTGDVVTIAQQIGCVGNTGTTTGYHLHYEIRKGKRFLNPRGWCEVWGIENPC